MGDSIQKYEEMRERANLPDSYIETRLNTPASKLLIIGHARHGKDTVAEMINRNFGLTAKGSSEAAAEIFLYDALKDKYGYKTPEDCFKDRVNHRAEWYDLICDYNRTDKARLAKAIMKDNDIYCGMRSAAEIRACREQGVFDLVIGVYDPRKQHEPTASFSIDLFKEADIVLTNNGTPSDLEWKVVKLLGPLLNVKPLEIIFDTSKFKSPSVSVSEFLRQHPYIQDSFRENAATRSVKKITFSEQLAENITERWWGEFPVDIEYQNPGRRNPLAEGKDDTVILAVDFDGTICEVDYPGIGREREGAKEWINKLYDEGYLIVINTCRSDEGEVKAMTMAKDFLDLRGIKYHAINENLPHLIKVYGCDTRKISADVYIDDKCLFDIPTWEEKYKIIKKKFPNAQK